MQACCNNIHSYRINQQQLKSEDRQHILNDKSTNHETYAITFATQYNTLQAYQGCCTGARGVREVRPLKASSL